MAKMFLATTVTLSLGLGLCSGKEETPRYLWKSCNGEESSNLYNTNFEIPNAFENETITMSDYSGQVLMVVNVASYWGFTYQYYALNELIEKMEGKNFSVLGFPCNQFARQEPAANATELYNGMAWVRPGLQRGYNFVPFFPLTKKIDVNGEKENPIFTHLKNVCPPPWEKFWPSEKNLWEPKQMNDIRWNFEKWLIDTDGKPFRRYSSYTEPQNLEQDINFLLGEADSPSIDGSAIEYYKNRMPKDLD